MDETTIQPGRQALATYLRQVMDDHHLSGRLLARKAGISESAVRTLISPERTKDLLGPHPHVLRAISNALDLDPVRLMYLAGYLAADEHKGLRLSEESTWFGYRLDHLPPDKQRILWDMLDAFEKSSGLEPIDARQRQIILRLHAFRREHPMFRRRRFSMRDEIGLQLGHLTRTTTEHLVIDKFMVVRLNELFADSLEQPITPDQIEQVLVHRDVALVLNDLLPRKEIPTSWEKLLWLTHPTGTMDRLSDSLTPEQQAGIKALWKLLEEVSQETDTD